MIELTIYIYTTGKGNFRRSKVDFNGDNSHKMLNIRLSLQLVIIRFLNKVRSTSMAHGSCDMSLNTECLQLLIKFDIVFNPG